MWIKDIRDYILYEDKEYGYGEPLEELYCSEGSG